jgi:hypothetical protein
MERKERLREKYGWVVFLGLGLLWLVVGLSQLFNPEELAEIKRITGMSFSELKASYPEATELVRFLYGTLGLTKTSWSLLVLSITLWPYRKGEKWAWYTLWLVPALLVSQGLFNSVYLGDFKEMLQWIPVTTVALLGLLLPYRKFFPK